MLTNLPGEPTSRTQARAGRAGSSAAGTLDNWAEVRRILGTENQLRRFTERNPTMGAHVRWLADAITTDRDPARWLRLLTADKPQNLAANGC
jgi:hypothetical protein